MTKRRNILFVCIGNTCRSPMAEYIARDISNNHICVTSCGINVTSMRINRKTVEVINDKLKIDLSKKTTELISNLELDKFDTIYSLDKAASKYLKELDIDTENLVELFVEDPFNLNLDKYYDIFNEIFIKLNRIKNKQGSI